MIEDSRPLRLGLALSGGGSRAIAFHLGCLRALNEIGLLNRIDVISSVSGGSVLAGLYCARAETFDSFERRIRSLLRAGLQDRIFGELLSPLGLRAFGSFLLNSASALPMALIGALASLTADWRVKAKLRRWLRARRRRPVTRTDFLERVLRDADLIGEVTMAELPAGRPRLVVNAAELATQTAFRFTTDGSGSWRTGPVVGVDFKLSEAVTASAAFPLLLPAIDREYDFQFGDKIVRRRVLLTDGGIYDNLGLQAFDPNRPAAYAFGVTHVDIIIACIAESGVPTGEDFPLFLGARARAAFSTAHRQLHRMGMGMLHEWRASGRILAFIMPYFGQDDTKLPSVEGDPDPPPLGDFRDYPIDFAAMPEDVIDALVARGEAQTRRLAKAYLNPLPQKQAAEKP
ncbi:MAG: patatin-like phospholipase family protein [Alphaproteobacteria bacterium]|nr:patatin-like phospholipase family protein [Alphaproteobacteria bacterium]